MSKTAQVGGDHYKSKVQHWDLMEKYDIEYLLGNASKYLVRWRKKGGLQDLEKAQSYLKRWMEEPHRYARRLVPSIALNDWLLSIGFLSVDEEYKIIDQIHGTGNVAAASIRLEHYIEEIREAPSAYQNDRV